MEEVFGGMIEKPIVRNYHVASPEPLVVTRRGLCLVASQPPVACADHALSLAVV